MTKKTKKKKSSPAWQRSEGKDPKGGLNAKGRASYNRSTGGNLKPPVKKAEAARSKKSAARRKSFCARMTGMKRETRLARLLMTQIVELTNPFAHGIVKTSLENRKFNGTRQRFSK